MVAPKYRVEVVDQDYYRRQISCQYACPTHTDARGYVNAIADREYERGYIEARQPNPFASTCGRVCNAPCEEACRRGHIDAPVAIRALKRFLTERYGVETLARLPIARAPGQEAGARLLKGPAPGNSLTAESVAALTRMSGLFTRLRAKVAVIGAGPAGLTAAHDLALLGYSVTIFEASSRPGGMLLLGLPEYRLPRDLVRVEVEELLGRGVELRLNARLGRDFDIASLKEDGYEAILIAIGAYQDRELGVEGSELDGVLNAIEFLLNANMGYRVELGQKVLVVGGGGVAIDAARVVTRLVGGEIQPETGDGMTGIEAAREALRLGVKEVHVIYRGTREEMRAPEEEIQDALDEGVQLHTGLAPKRVLGAQSKVVGLETLEIRSVIDNKGKRTRYLVPGSESVFEGDTVIVAIGQESDLSFIRPGDSIEITPQGTIAVDPESLATTAPGVFAGGDVAFGPRIIIEAVRDGHKAARSIEEYLQKRKVEIVRRGWLEVMPLEKLPPTARLEVPRQRPPTLPLERRLGIAEVELEYPEAMAQEQANRCLRCHIQTVFNSDLCILCGGCVDVCPQSCLRLVKLDKIEGDERLNVLVEARCGLPVESFRRGGEALEEGTAILKDETQCIRCGLCARRCPVGAITMEAFWFEEELAYRRDAEAEKTPAGEKA